MVKQFGVFAGSVYYPEGGWGDFRASFDTKEAAFGYAKAVCPDPVGPDEWWYMIVDFASEKILADRVFRCE